MSKTRPRWRTGKAGLTLGAVLILGGMAPFEAPVADAAMRGDIEAVRSLLRSGADVNAAQGDGMTALHWAARLGQRELAEVLVFAGARLDSGTRIGRYTPLHIAAREGRREVVKVLLRAGADPDLSTTNSGATPLHLAARSGDTEIITLLVEHGARVDAKAGSWEQTPLIFAAALNRAEAIQVLIESGADPNLSSAVVDVVEMAAADNAAERRLQEAIEGFRDQQAGGPDWQPTPSQVQAAVDLARQVQTRWSEISRQEDEASADSATAGGESDNSDVESTSEADPSTIEEDADEGSTSEREDQEASGEAESEEEEEE
ncbi:MAG: ankyrin repeat domain-containing protein, partial [Gemmatimonadota bacterium]|nr:ankyrin repeat domain-containing protein [Gemmatimonadota bacterium]